MFLSSGDKVCLRFGNSNNAKISLFHEFSEAPSRISLASESTISVVSFDGGFPELPELCTHFVANSTPIEEEEAEGGGEAPSEDNGQR